MTASTFNLLDTPGHQDFSEDTYRTLTAVDSAVMVIDAAKGIEAQTLKLFEVCRLRDVPIITFINKLDREGRDPFDLMDEIERTAGARRDARRAGRSAWGATSSAPTISSPIRCCCSSAARGERIVEPVRLRAGSTIRKLETLLPARGAEAAARGGGDGARRSARAFDRETYREGHMTPVFFGSALNNFGVRELLARHRRARALAPAAAGAAARRSRPTSRRSPASSSRCRPISTRSIATASPSCGSAPGASAAA